MYLLASAISKGLEPLPVRTTGDRGKRAQGPLKMEG